MLAAIGFSNRLITFDLSTCSPPAGSESYCAAFEPSPFVAVTSPLATLPIASSSGSPSTFARTWSTPGPTNGSASGTIPFGAVGQPGSTLPLRSTAYTRPLPPSTLARKFVRKFEKPPAAPPPGVCGADGLSSNSCVGVTMSSLPSPLMSPSAAVVMISAPGMLGSLQLLREAGHRVAAAVPDVDVLVERRHDDLEVAVLVQVAERGRGGEAALDVVVARAVLGRDSAGIDPHGEARHGRAVGLPGVDVLAGRVDDLGLLVAVDVADRRACAAPHAAGRPTP